MSLFFSLPHSCTMFIKYIEYKVELKFTLLKTELIFSNVLNYVFMFKSDTNISDTDILLIYIE